jgi:hypothetical protein
MTEFFFCVNQIVLKPKSKRNMTGRSLGCALSNLPLTGAYHTVVSLGAKTKPKLNFLHLMKEILHRGHLLLL